MAEYIERKRAIVDACNSLELYPSEYARLEDAIAKIPAADVAPVRHGRWKCNKPCPVCGEDRFKGLDADIWADWEPPYCPICGAKMDGGSD